MKQWLIAMGLSFLAGTVVGWQAHTRYNAPVPVQIAAHGQQTKPDGTVLAARTIPQPLPAVLPLALPPQAKPQAFFTVTTAPATPQLKPNASVPGLTTAELQQALAEVDCPAGTVTGAVVVNADKTPDLVVKGMNGTKVDTANLTPIAGAYTTPAVHLWEAGLVYGTNHLEAAYLKRDVGPLTIGTQAGRSDLTRGYVAATLGFRFSGF